MKRAVALLPLLLLASCGGGSDEAESADVGSDTTAEVQCERFIAQRQGQQLDDLDFEHRETAEDKAPTYVVRGIASGGGRSFGYECTITFDGQETWTLDNLTLL